MKARVLSRLYIEQCINGRRKEIGCVFLIKFLEQPCETPTGSMILSSKTETHSSQTQSQVKSRASERGIIGRCEQFYFAAFALQRGEESQ